MRQDAVFLDKERLIDQLKEIKLFLGEKYQVKRLGIFGSFARGEASANSDIDIFVEMEPNLFLRASLKEELERLFATRVDVVRYWKGMNPLLKKRIDRDGIFI